LPPNSEPWIAGSAYPGLHLIMAILPAGDLNEVKRVVPHEISHQVLGQATADPFNYPPKWLDEGLAVYSQESGREKFYRRALELAADGEVPPLATLNGEFPYDPDAALAAYAYSLSAVIYILDTYGDEGMARLIAAFPEGITYDDTILQALGVSFDELDRQWREDLVADAQRGDATIGTPLSSGPTPTNMPETNQAPATRTLPWEAAGGDAAIDTSHEGRCALCLVAMVGAIGRQLEPDITRALRQAGGRRHCQRAEEPGFSRVVEERAGKAVGLLFGLERRGDAHVRELLDWWPHSWPSTGARLATTCWLSRRFGDGG
jgi:hypothetical protein